MAKSKKAKKPKEPWNLAKELEKLGPRPPAFLACEHCQQLFENGDVAPVISMGTALAKRRADWDARRAEIDRRDVKERHRAAKKAGQAMPDGYAPVAAAQETHSPTERIDIRDIPPIDPVTGKPMRDAVVAPARVRASQARLMNSLDSWQQDAMVQIGRAIEIMFPGRTNSQKFERTDPVFQSGGESAGRIQIQQDYFRWARDLQRLGIDHAAIYVIVAQGKTLEEADKIRRRRNGYCKAHLMAGLDHWCWRAGWRKHPSGLVAAAAVRIWVRRLSGALTVYEATRPASVATASDARSGNPMPMVAA